MMNVLFVHIPKTSGTSVRNSLIASENHTFPEWMVSHLTHLQLESRCKHHNYKPDYSFTIVRNPYDRAISTYYHLRQHIRPPHYMRRKSVKFYLNFLTLSFKDYVKFFYYNTFEIANYLTVSYHFLPQSTYLDSASKIKIFKMENLIDLENDLSIKISKDRVNKERLENKKNLYDDETIEMVKNFYKQDFINFDYDEDNFTYD